MKIALLGVPQIKVKPLFEENDEKDPFFLFRKKERSKEKPFEAKKI